MPLTTVLFDLDNTLFDHIGTARAALAASDVRLQAVDPEVLCQYYSELGMCHLEDVLITSEDVGVPKPDARIFEVASAGWAPSRRKRYWSIIGLPDVLGILGAGIRPVWINRIGAPRQQAHVQELAGLLPVLAVWQTITGWVVVVWGPAA